MIRYVFKHSQYDYSEEYVGIRPTSEHGITVVTFKSACVGSKRPNLCTKRLDCCNSSGGSCSTHFSRRRVPRHATPLRLVDP